MDTRWLGWALFALILGGFAAFPWIDQHYLRLQPPRRSDANGGELAIEPLFAVAFGGGAFALGLVTGFAAASQSSIGGGILSGAFWLMGFYVCAQSLQTRIAWDDEGLEQRRHWPGKLVRIRWSEIARLGGLPHSPEYAESKDGQRVSWSLCRGRLVLFEWIQSKRPDLLAL